MKVLMVPSPLNDNGASGIATVLREYGRYMPGMGVEFVKTEEDADIVAVHAGAYYPQTLQFLWLRFATGCIGLGIITPTLLSTK
jgi:hypothetical protein